MKIYVRKNGFEPRAFLTKAAAFDALRDEMNQYKIVEALALALGGVKNRKVLDDIIKYITIDTDYLNLIIDTYIEHSFNAEFDEYEVADVEDIDEWMETL